VIVIAALLILYLVVPYFVTTGDNSVVEQLNDWVQLFSSIDIAKAKVHMRTQY
jgi:hypothetical protein